MLKKCLLVLYYGTVFLPCILGLPKKKFLAGLFEDVVSKDAFIMSVKAVNEMRSTSDDLSKIFFGPEFYDIDNNLFEISQITNSIRGNKTIAIFGPANKASADHVQSICDSMAMPNVVARYDVNPIATESRTFNLYPHIEELSDVFLRMVMDYNWQKFTILYDNSEGLVLANKLIKRWDPSGHTVTIRHLGKGPNYRNVLNAVKKSKEKHIVIDCSYEILEELLMQCQQVGIFSDKHEIIVTNLDLNTLNLEPYQYSGVNFSGVRLVDVEDPVSQKIFDQGLCDNGYFEEFDKLRVVPALVYDSVQFFARAFKNVGSLARHGVRYWASTLSSFMHTTEMRGLTGLVTLDGKGLRSNFELDILRLSPNGTRNVGKYNSTSGITWKSDGSLGLPQRKMYRVLISLLAPHNMLKKSAESKSGNDRYEGFAIDIIHELSVLLDFNYTFIQTELSPGSQGKNGKWNGMLGLIADGVADLAITDLTITADRQKVVDFSLPFQNLGIQVLFKKPTKAPPTLFSYLSPFKPETWYNLCGSTILVSLCFFVIGRSCPAEWNNPYPCIEEPDYLENQFTLKNSFWFTLGSIMQQGSEIAPIGLSTRMLASVWYFFCLVIAALYTANLASYLIVEMTVVQIRNVDDLANFEGAIKYGAKRGGATFNYFNVSDHPPYIKMKEYMVKHDKEVMTENNEEGMNKVKRGNYAFLMESSSIEYITRRECDLTSVGDLLDHKGYGIAMRKNSPDRHSFNQAILTLQENGRLTNLMKHWWEIDRGGNNCTGKDLEPDKALGLTLDNVGGVFLTLVIGLVVATTITFWECCWKIRSNAKKKDSSFKDELAKEAKFLMKCKGTLKTTDERKTSGETTETSTRASTPPYDIMPIIVTN